MRLGLAYMDKGRGQEAYRALSLVRRLYPANWFAPLGLAALLAAPSGSTGPPAPRRGPAQGGDAARAEAGGYPVLAPLLAEVSGSASR